MSNEQYFGISGSLPKGNSIQNPKSKTQNRKIRHQRHRTNHSFIHRFEGGQESPPGTLVTLTYDVSSTLPTLTQVNVARTRIRGSAVNATAENIALQLDGARLLVDDTTAAPASAPGPSPTPSQTSVPGSAHLDQRLLARKPPAQVTA